jgi:hypothetical protein
MRQSPSSASGEQFRREPRERGLRRLHSFSSVLPPAGESGTSCEEAFRLELKEHPLYKAGGIGSFISPSWDSPACQQLRGNDGEERG